MLNQELDAEELELLEEQKLQGDLDFLLKNPQFQRVILDRYINQTALVLGSNFTGSDGEVEALKAVSHLNMFIAANK